MRLNGGVWKAGSLLCALLLVLLADPAAAWDPRSLLAPCHGDCGASIYGGWYVENSMGQVLVTAPEAPLTWELELQACDDKSCLAPAWVPVTVTVLPAE